MSDTLCNGYLELIKGPNPESELRRFRDDANTKRIADGGVQSLLDLYLTALLNALDNATSEEDARVCVWKSVKRQLGRPDARFRYR